MNIVTLYKNAEQVCNAVGFEGDQALKDRATWAAKIEELKAKLTKDYERQIEELDAFAYQLAESCANRAQRMSQTIGQDEPQRIAAE